MLGQIWATIQFLRELWEQLLILIGMIEKAKHESAKEEIKEKTDIIADPTKPDEERHEATKDLEDIINKRS